MIIGDVLSKEIPSLEIQNWLLNYRKISKINNLVVKTLSGFYVAPSDIKIEPLWIESLQENIKAEMVYPPILSLKLNRANLSLEDGALELVKSYSNDFFKFFIEE